MTDLMRSTIKNNTILVAGGAGFIGSHIVDRLITENAKEVIVIDNMFLGNELNLRSALSKEVVLYKDDAEFTYSLDHIFEQHNIDIVFNCATKALNYSFVNPRGAYQINANVTLNFLELQRRKAFNTLCHFSTSEVYGTALYDPIDEQHPIRPTTTYAAGKAAADIALESYVRMFGLDAFIVRPFNNYGPRQNYRGYLAGVIPTTIWKILSGKTPEIHGDGSQSRDFIYVNDTVDCAIKLYDVIPPGEAINISSNSQITIRYLISKIADLMDYRGEILRVKSRKSDVQEHDGCNKKIKSIIDYQLTPFDVGLKHTIDWYKQVAGSR